MLLAFKKGDAADAVESIGHFYQNNADVVGHREQHFAEGIGLFERFAFHIEARNALRTADNIYDGRPELPFDFFGIDVFKFQNIVQKAGNDTFAVQLVFRQNTSDAHRVQNVRLTAGALFVSRLCAQEFPAGLYKIFVFSGIIGIFAEKSFHKKLRIRYCSV